MKIKASLCCTCLLGLEREWTVPTMSLSMQIDANNMLTFRQNGSTVTGHILQPFSVGKLELYSKRNITSRELYFDLNYFKENRINIAVFIIFVARQYSPCAILNLRRKLLVIRSYNWLKTRHPGIPYTAVKRKNPTPLPVFAASNFVRV